MKIDTRTPSNDAAYIEIKMKTNKSFGRAYTQCPKTALNVFYGVCVCVSLSIYLCHFLSFTLCMYACAITLKSHECKLIQNKMKRKIEWKTCAYICTRYEELNVQILTIHICIHVRTAKRTNKQMNATKNMLHWECANRTKVFIY